MGELLTKIRIGDGKALKIRPVPRKLCLGERAFSLRQILNHKGGLIVGEGDTGKTTFVEMMEKAAEAQGMMPTLVRLRRRGELTLPPVIEGKTRLVIFDGLDEFPECARDLVDLTDDLNEEEYHVWVTSRPGNAASIVATSSMLENVYRLNDFSGKDIKRIAASVNLDGQDFLSVAKSTHLESFLAKPGGAVIMLQLYAQGRLKGSDRIRLMESIMRDFARETRDGGPVVVRKIPFAEDQLVDATCWIAACLMITGKDAVWIGEESRAPITDIPLSQIPEREHRRDIFTAALGLRLFEPLNSERLRLAYSEMPSFLAGRWLAMHASLDEVKSIVPEDEEFFTTQQARALAWASCFNPELGRPWLSVRPEMFLSSHSLIVEYGCDRFFGLLLKEYEKRKPTYPAGLFDGNLGDLSGFKELIGTLGEIVASTKSKSALALASVMLQYAAHEDEELVEVLVERLLNTDIEDDLNVYRLLRAIAWICGTKRYECLSRLKVFTRLTQKSLTMDDIRNYAHKLCRDYEPPKPLLPEQDDDQLSDEEENESHVFTEHEVAEILEDYEIEELGAVIPVPKEEPEIFLSEEDEELLEELYPEHPEDWQSFDKDDWEEYNESRQEAREYLNMQRLYAYDETDENRKVYDDEDKEEEEKEQLDPKNSIIDQVVRSQNCRGLNYCSLTRYFREYFGEENVDIFVCPKLLIYAIHQEPSVYIERLIKGLMADYFGGIEFLKWALRNGFLEYLEEGIACAEPLDVVKFYAFVLGAHRVFHDALLPALENRIIKEPTDEVVNAVFDLEVFESEDEVDVDPDVLDNTFVDEDYPMSLEVASRTNLAQDDFCYRRVTELCERIQRRRDALDGKLLVTVDQLSGIGIKKAEPPKVDLTDEALKKVAEAVEVPKNKGGRPKKDATGYTQKYVAEMFGKPCNAEKIANWESYVRTGGKRGSVPPSANYNGIRISYSEELRKNPSKDDNLAKLTAVIKAYQASAKVKQNVGDKIELKRFKSEESMYKYQHGEAMGIRKNP